MILEHHQLDNGEVTVPEILVPFCRGKKKLELKPDWPIMVFKDHGEKIASLVPQDQTEYEEYLMRVQQRKETLETYYKSLARQP